ncbi:MAG: hydroxyethylthiazole kinase [Clostridia bacterium]|nr:hydroxyethylthiazole kinase [Clostridia bacterium]
MGTAEDVTYSRVWPHPEIVEDLAKLRQNAPLTHCITNIVVTNFTANVLLATGASPAMVVTIEEVADFVGIAQALLINVGTITGHDAEVMLKAAATAHETNTPWVLDPVAAGAIEFRTKVVADLIRYRPSVIRGNASEILAVAGSVGGAKGVDSTAASIAALPAARQLAESTGAVVAISGETDYITDGKVVTSVPGGHEILTKVTGTGCTLGALIAAFLPVTESPLRAATAASAIFAAAGERAAKEAHGTGSFAVAFLDQLSLIGV